MKPDVLADNAPDKFFDYYVRPKLGKLLLKKVEASDIDELYAEMAEKYQRTTVYFVHSLLKMVFNLAIKRRKIVFNPMEGVTSPGGSDFEKFKKARREKQIMAPEDIERFLTAANEVGTLPAHKLTRNVKMISEGATNCRLSNSAQIELCNTARRVWGMPLIGRIFALCSVPARYRS